MIRCNEHQLAVGQRAAADSGRQESTTAASRRTTDDSLIEVVHGSAWRRDARVRLRGPGPLRQRAASPTRWSRASSWPRATSSARASRSCSAASCQGPTAASSWLGGLPDMAAFERASVDRQRRSELGLRCARWPPGRASTPPETSFIAVWPERSDPTVTGPTRSPPGIGTASSLRAAGTRRSARAVISALQLARDQQRDHERHDREVVDGVGAAALQARLAAGCRRWRGSRAGRRA